MIRTSHTQRPASIQNAICLNQEVSLKRALLTWWIHSHHYQLRFVLSVSIPLSFRCARWGSVSASGRKASEIETFLAFSRSFFFWTSRTIFRTCSPNAFAPARKVLVEWKAECFYFILGVFSKWFRIGCKSWFRVWATAFFRSSGWRSPVTNSFFTSSALLNNLEFSRRKKKSAKKMFVETFFFCTIVYFSGLCFLLTRNSSRAKEITFSTSSKKKNT